MKAVTLLFALELSAVVAATQRIGQSAIVLIVRPAEYFGNTYTAPPQDGATHVWFVGERVILEVNLANWGTEAETLVPGPSGPRDDFTCRVVESDAPTKIDLSFDAIGRHVSSGGRYEAAWEKGVGIMLEPKAMITVRASVIAKLDVPGVYTIEVATTVTDSKARTPRPQGARFRFELRVPSPEDRSEVARRAALRAFLAGNYESAEGLANDLLAANPSSHIAHVIHGDIAAARGNTTGAIRNYEAALSLLANGSDTVFLRWASQSYVEDSLVAIREKLTRVRAGPP